MKKVYIFITTILPALVFLSCAAPTEEVLDRSTSTGNERNDRNDNEGNDENNDGKETLPEIFFSTASIMIKEADKCVPSTSAFTIICNDITTDDDVMATLVVDNSNYPTKERAVEGVDFIIKADKTLHFSKNESSVTIDITTIDNNDIQYCDHCFDIIIGETIGCTTKQPYKLSVRIIDDENPQNTPIGRYAASAQSMFTDINEPSAHYEYWNVNITRDTTNMNVLIIQPICSFMGLADASISPIYATFDKIEAIMQVEYGQSLVYNADTGDNYAFVGVTDDMKPITNGYATAMLCLDRNNKLVIEFQDNIGVTNLANEQPSELLQAISNVKFEMK